MACGNPIAHPTIRGPRGNSYENSFVSSHRLSGARKGFSVTLNPDLNILTGRNGSGKTNLLKLIWYIISGNILLALQEVQFQRAVLMMLTNAS